MAHHLRHFAIPADDVARAKAFYEDVFGWRITPWGPPGFYLIATGTDDDPGVHGALQQRPAPLQGRGVRGYECTFGVDDVEAVSARALAHGAQLLHPKTRIPTVGELVMLEDTEGNPFGVMRYDER